MTASSQRRSGKHGRAAKKGRPKIEPKRRWKIKSQLTRDLEDPAYRKRFEAGYKQFKREVSRDLEHEAKVARLKTTGWRIGSLRELLGLSAEKETAIERRLSSRSASPFDRDVLKAIESDPKFAVAYFDELRERPIEVRIALLRQLAPAAKKAKARKKAQQR